MSDDKDIYAFYANKDIAPPANDYWSHRRRVASLIRSLQEQVQTTELPIEALNTLGNELEGQLRKLSDKPQLLGRTAWVEAEIYGDWSVFQTEVTPILGPSNPISPGLSIWFEKDKSFASVTFSWMYEGADNIVHGAWVAAVFDEFLGTAQVLSGRRGMTGSLTTQYHKPTPVNQELRLEAKVKSIEDRKITVVGEMWADDILTASCEGLFILPENKEISKAFSDAPPAEREASGGPPKGGVKKQNL